MSTTHKMYKILGNNFIASNINSVNKEDLNDNVR